MHAVTGRNAASSSIINHAAFGLWNPHSSLLIKVLEIILTTNDFGGSKWSGAFRRTTERGTPGSTVTPDISNSSRRGAAPASGLLLDLAAYSVQPTLESDDWGSVIIASGSNRGGVHRFRFGTGLYIPPGAGMALISVEADSSPAFDISAFWTED